MRAELPVTRHSLNLMSQVQVQAAGLSFLRVPSYMRGHGHVHVDGGSARRAKVDGGGVVEEGRRQREEEDWNQACLGLEMTGIRLVWDWR
jgi:hypothetical protein